MCFRRSAEERCHFLPREAHRSEEGRRPSPEGSDRGIPAKGGPRRVETPHLALETRNVDRDSAARGRRGPESIPGQPPKRFGPSRTVATWSRVWPRSRSSRGISEETGCGGGYAFDRSRPRLALSSNRSGERGLSGCVTCLPSETGPSRSATVGDPRGARRSAPAEADWCLGGHCRSRPNPGRSEISGHSMN